MSEQNAPAAGLRRWLQFRLWMLLALVTLAAVISLPLAWWWNRPDGPVTVSVTASGAVMIDERIVAAEDLERVLSRERRRREHWNEPAVLRMRVDPVTRQEHIVELINLSAGVGFEQFTLQAADPIQLNKAVQAATQQQSNQ